MNTSVGDVGRDPDPAIEDPDDRGPRRPSSTSTSIGSPAGLYLSALLRRFSTSISSAIESAWTMSDGGWIAQPDLAIGMAPAARLDRRPDDVVEDVRLAVELRPGAQAGELEQVLDDPQQAIGIVADVA